MMMQPQPYVILNPQLHSSSVGGMCFGDGVKFVPGVVANSVHGSGSGGGYILLSSNSNPLFRLGGGANVTGKLT